MHICLWFFVKSPKISILWKFSIFNNFRFFTKSCICTPILPDSSYYLGYGCCSRGSYICIYLLVSRKITDFCKNFDFSKFDHFCVLGAVDRTNRLIHVSNIAYFCSKMVIFVIFKNFQQFLFFENFSSTFVFKGCN